MNIMTLLKRWMLILTVVFLSFTMALHSSELTSLSPVTDSIVLLTFDDGWVKIAPEGQWWGQGDQVFHEPLDIEMAQEPSNYTIISETDTNYKNGRHPVKIGMKSKMGDASWKGHTAILNHWIYLHLPYPMLSGNSYKVMTGNLAKNKSSDTIAYNPLQNFSEAIHINQVGFLPDARLKFGYVYQWLGTDGPLDLDGYAGTAFHLVEEASADIVFTGIIEKRRDIEGQAGLKDTYNDTDGPFYSGADVWQCDFSSFSEPGEYRLVVDRIGCTFPFGIRNDVYREAYHVAVRGLYHHRSGPERTVPYSKWYKGVDHTPGVSGFKIEYSQHRAMDKMNAFEELPAKTTGNTMNEAWGGWFDAGDFDRQANHMIASNLLMLNYLLGPEKYADDDLNIPESGNGIPDILDEAAWGIDLFRRAKGPTGGIIGGLEANDHPHQRGSVADGRNLDWFAYAEEPKASYQYAATAIQLASCLETAGFPELVQDLYTESVNAFSWAQRNLQNGDYEKTKNERLRAAAWLYHFTGKDSFQYIFLTEFAANARDKDNYHMGLYGFLLADYPNRNQSFYEQVKNVIIDRANELVISGKQRACRLASYDLNDFMRVGKATTPYINDLLMAYYLTKDSVYIDFAQTTCDYFLGGNPVNYVYITGLGDRPVTDVFNLDAFYDNQEEPIPGIVPYGHHTYGKWMENSGLTPHNHLFNLKNTYPVWQKWPSHEFWFSNRFSIIHSEYTIKQNIGPAAAAYSYFLDSITATPDSVLRYIITYPLNNTIFSADDEVIIEADVKLSAGIKEVVFYLNNQLIGSVSQAPYVFNISDLKPGSYEVTMEVTDESDKKYSTTSSVVNFEVIHETSNQFNEVQGLEVYPNPSSGQINISCQPELFKIETVKLLNSLGNTVFQECNPDFTTNLYTINLGEALSPGIYLLSVENSQHLLISKIVVH